MDTGTSHIFGPFPENKQRMLEVLGSVIERYDDEKEYREHRRNNIRSL